MASPSRTVYVGVTNDLFRRVLEHKSKPPGAFCSRYNVTRLVFVEEADGPSTAIAREKQIKSWRRSKKLELIESVNPRWEDLGAAWGGGGTEPGFLASKTALGMTGTEIVRKSSGRILKTKQH